jgi:hypothetical protein
MTNGTTLLDPSLDLCSGVYPSEKDRLERRQVMATKAGSTFSFLSTEVVKYSSAAAATAAQKELVKVLAQCQLDKGYKDSTGTLIPYEFKKFPAAATGVVSEGNHVHWALCSKRQGFYRCSSSQMDEGCRNYGPKAAGQSFLDLLS